MPTQDAHLDTLRSLVADRVATRLFRRDASLWPAPSEGGDPPERTLGWLDLPGRLHELSVELTGFATEVRDEGFTDAVVCGMGGSSMTPEVLRATFGTRADGLRLHVLDTVHPDTVSRVTNSMDLSKTLFMVASKSGTTIEPLSLEAHFREALSLVADDPSHHFVALTDAGSPMAKRASKGEFRKLFETPADVGGRFSALSAFGMLPAALMGIDSGEFASTAQSERDSLDRDEKTNLALELGAFMGANAVEGRDKVTLLTSPSLSRFSLWVEQLLAESTGKNGLGLVPVANEPQMPPGEYGNDRQFVVVRLEGDDNSELDDMARQLDRAGYPILLQDIPSVDHLGSIFFQWEFAVAVAGHVIGVYPFDQPDVELAKQKARAILSGDSSGASSETQGILEALDKLLESPQPGGYFAIGAFVDESDELTAAFDRLREAISSRTGQATTFGYGPRYQHSIGQLYKGGPANVTMLILKSHGNVDLPVPGAPYTLSALTGAMADGDAQAMSDRGRRAEAAVMGNNPVADVIAAAAKLDQKH